MAIPSHRRSEMLGKKTLRFLRESGAPKPTIYVADEEDLTAYRNLYPDLPILLAPKGISNTRNFIQDTQPLGKMIVFIDDDIDEVFHLDPSNPKKKYKVRDFNGLIKEAFHCAERAGTTFWGTYPIDNVLCMKPFIRRNLCYINGSLFGVINSRVSVALDLAEDYERSIKYWNKEGRLCRLDFVGLLTKYYKNKGGLQEKRTDALNTEDKFKLVEQYPHLCKLIKRKGVWDEISFKRFPSYMLPMEEGEGGSATS